MEAPKLPPSERVFVTGVSGSGKTEFIYRRVLPRFPRLLLIDQTGEWSQRFPDRGIVYGYDATVAKLREQVGYREWWVFAYLEKEELERLAEKVLVPVPNPRKGFSANVGGMALYLDEVDVVCPNSRTTPALQHLWRRGRHASLSVVAASQRPAQVSKEVVSQCNQIVTLAQHEPNDVAYLTKLLGKPVAAQMLAHVNRVQYGAFVWYTLEGRGEMLDAKGKVIRNVKGFTGPDPELDLDK